MKKTIVSDQFFSQEERIEYIATVLKGLQIKAADEGCRKLRRLIEAARDEALKKALSVERDKRPLDSVMRLVNNA